MSKPTSKKNRAKTWFLVHSWLALPIWFFLLIVCVTGTLAVVSQEIVWLANPEIRASQPDDDAQPLSYGQVLAAIQKERPELAVEWLSSPEESHFALTASVSEPGGGTYRLYINPYSGAIQGVSPTFDFSAFTRALHGWWLVPFTNGYSWGWYLVSLLGLPMLVSLITGLVVYKRFWKGFFTPRLRVTQGARIFWGDFHRLSGIWSIWFIAVISITGTWFLIEAMLSDFHISISSEGPPSFVARQEVPLTADGLAPPRLGLDQVTAIAAEKIPGLEVSFITLPEDAFSHYGIGGRGWYPLMFQTAEINPYTGEVAGANLLSDRSTLEFVTESMRPLHTGDFGGLWIKLIWAFFGLVLSMMVLSGLLIWSKRTVQATANLAKRAQRGKLRLAATTVSEGQP
jgi:uncharacterized iron-regulated membrane protein